MITRCTSLQGRYWSSRCARSGLALRERDPERVGHDTRLCLKHVSVRECTSEGGSLGTLPGIHCIRLRVIVQLVCSRGSTLASYKYVLEVSVAAVWLKF